MRCLPWLLLTVALPLTGPAAEPDTAWSALSPNASRGALNHPCAVGRGGKTFAGWITANGSVQVGALDHSNGVVQTSSLFEKFERDDRSSPALLFQPDGRLMAFYARRGGNDLHLRVTTEPGDVSHWTPDRTLGLPGGSTFLHPVLLTNELNSLYLFFGGTNGAPALSVSPDLGTTWTPAREMIRRMANRRPQVSVWSDGASRIDLAFTDGQPGDESSNAVYFARYEKGAFWKADGTRIAGLDDLPLEPGDCDRVYDGATAGRAGLWDVAEDAAGQPVLAYARLPRATDHRYRYARWDGKKWIDHEICPGGRSFEQAGAGGPAPDPYSSGGMSLNAVRPAEVVLSRPVKDRFEIERWTTPDGGQTWSTEALTAGSRQDNVRPVVVRNPDGSGPAVLWLNLRRYEHSTRYDASLLMDRKAPVPRLLSGQRAPGAILAAMEAVADWQLAHPSRYKTTDWTQGALYAGLMALAGISPDSRYREALKAVGEQNSWNPGASVYGADDHCVGQTYAELFESYGEQRMLAPLQERFDFILAHPATNQLLFTGPLEDATKRWSWCDALFMAPPAWLRLYRLTGDLRYRDFAVAEWWKTSQLLYDPAEHLFHHDSRYLSQREANGRKAFGSRGNGWVMGGLVRVLQALPAEDPDRPRFVAQFQAMAEVVVKCQQPDGLWRSSLLDPASYPLQETSGSAFFTFALAWGINQGLLTRTACGPTVFRGWEALLRCVNPDGRLTRVQPVGADPRQFDGQNTEPYGVGAFLLAGTELYRMALQDAVKQARVRIRNPVDGRRGPETVELRWADVVARLGGDPGDSVAVLDLATSKLLDRQILDEDGAGQPDQLLFQSSFLPGETRHFVLLSDLSEGNQPRPAGTAHGWPTADNKGGYAWENDRIAFRVAGSAAPEPGGEAGGSGLGVWVKSAGRSVLSEAGTFQGAGAEAYKVGNTRGCGGLAIVEERTLFTSAPVAACKTLADGPIRTVVELDYAAWTAGQRQVRETKRIALDRGSHLNRIESRLIADPPGDLTVAVGLATRTGNGAMQIVEKEGWLTYSTPEAAPNGQIHTAMIIPGGLTLMPHAEHWLAVQSLTAGTPLVYFAGAGWSKADFPTPASWQLYVQLFAWNIAHPLEAGWEE